MKPVDKALAARRNWPFRSPDPGIAFERRFQRALAVLDLVEEHGRHPVQLEARRLFVVAVCAAFEARWRDFIRDSIDLGGITLNSAPNLARLQFSVADLREILGRKLTLGELIGAAYTFQSAEAVDRALSDVLGIRAFAKFAEWEVTFVEAVRKNRSSKHGPPGRIVFKGNEILKRAGDVNRAFAIRHDTVHDNGARHRLTARATRSLANSIWQFSMFLQAFAEDELKREPSPNRALEPTARRR